MKKFAIVIIFLSAVILGSAFNHKLRAQESSPQNAPVASDRSPCAVTVKGRRLFIYYSPLEGKSPQERARDTALKVERITKDHTFEPGLVRLAETPVGTNVTYNGEIIATVTIEDAKVHRSSTSALARRLARDLRGALVEKKEEFTAAKAAMAVTVATIATIVLIVATIIVFQLGSFFTNKLDQWKGSKIKSIKIQKATLISADMVANFFSSVVHIAQFIVFLLGLYAYAIIVLEAFPNTTHIGISLKEASIQPLQHAFQSFIDYLPNLFAILVIALITYGAIALSRFFFDAIDANTISISGFDQEWAKPTYKLTRGFIIAFFLVLALPYAPGWESESFKQVGLLFGLLVSLGSTSVIGHIMAGTVLTYSKAFKVGDRICVGTCIGDIIEKSMFVTRIKTPKNEIISIPNAEILNSHITNYSKMASYGELILHTKVTIGYDVPWRVVQDLLIKAALNTENILEEPAPFVLKQELADFSITYELNAFTRESHLMQQIYSNLHQNIIDKFNEAGLEIMSPRIISLRDGNALQLPEENLESGYQKPAFEVAIKDSSKAGTKKKSG